MVSFQKIVILGSSEDYRNEIPRHIVAEIVLMDKTHPEDGRPALYQVTESHLGPEINDLPVNSLTQVGDDLFVMVGQVVSFDKEAKQIYLANGDLVSYRHLITVGGSRQADDFNPALSTFMKSLRIQRSIKQRPLVVSPDPRITTDHKINRSNNELPYAELIAAQGAAASQHGASAHAHSVCSFELSEQ